MAFERLIRFAAEDGETYYGNLEKEVPTLEIEGSEVEVLKGDLESGWEKTREKKKVAKVRTHPTCLLPALENG